MTGHLKKGAALLGIGSMATRDLMTRLTKQYEDECGCRIDMTFLGGVEVAQRIEAGEAFDFAVLASLTLGRLAENGCIESARTDIAISEMVAAVAQQARLPDISSEASLRDIILQTSRIGYSTGPSGDHLLRLLQRWGIVEKVSPHLVRASPGVPVGSLIARGEVEIGFQQLSELMHTPGVRVVGPLPGDARLVTIFSAVICTSSTRRNETARFLEFLKSECRFGAEEASN